MDSVPTVVLVIAGRVNSLSAIFVYTKLKDNSIKDNHNNKTKVSYVYNANILLRGCYSFIINLYLHLLI